MVPFQRTRPASGSTISPDSGPPRNKSSSSLACTASPRFAAGAPAFDEASNASTAPAVPPCVLAIYDAAWYGSPSVQAAASASTAQPKASWYANAAATGSTPSLYQDDVLEGPVSALLPEALPPDSNWGAPVFVVRGTSNGTSNSTADALGSPTRAGADYRTHGGHYGDLVEEATAGTSRLLLTAVPHWQQQQQPQQQQQQQTGELLQHTLQQQGSQESPFAQQQQQQEVLQAMQQVAFPIRGSDAAECSTSGREAAGDHKPVLGTWAHRQYKLPLPGHHHQQNRSQVSRLPPHEEGQEQAQQQQQQSFVERSMPSSVAQPIPGTRQLQADPAAAAGGGAGAAADAAADAENGCAARSHASEDEDELIARAAWRWRFAKRWQAEQARLLDPNASAGEGDGMEDALAYLAACGQPWDLARTLSVDGLGGSSGSAPRMLGTLGSVGLLGQEQLLVGELSRNASYTGSPGTGTRRAPANGAPRNPAGGGGGRGGGEGGAGRRGVATRELSAVTQRATQLLRTQNVLESAADERWREAQAPKGGELWVGALLEAVEVDDWGKFKFVLVRLRDHTGKQKLLVRGSNYSSEGKLVEALHRQLLAIAAQNDVPAEPLETIGGGVMEWRRDRDRHLHLHSAFVAPHSSGPNGPMTTGEVLSLAGVLTKQSLPIHYKVTLDGGRTL